MITPYYQEDGITIYCGDCLGIIPVVGLVDLIATDPPYGEGQASWDLEKPPDLIWNLMHNSLKNGGSLYYFGFWGHADWILSNAKRVNLIPQSRIVWWFRTGRPEKESYREDTEDIYYFSSGRPMTFNAQLYLEPYEDENNYVRYERDGKHPGTVWQESRIFHNHPENFGHETQKPISIMKKIVGISSNMGELVFDPFMGSGTTLVAAKQLGRRAIGIEISEKYCEIAVKRLAQMQLDFKQ